MQGVRRRDVASPRTGQRARYCRRCGAPLALAPSALGGVRCSNCGAQPGVRVMSASDLGVPSSAQSARQFVAVPMQLEPKSDVWTGRRDVAVVWARATALALVARGRRWAADLPPPSPKTWITAAAAGIGIALSIAVVLAIG